MRTVETCAPGCNRTNASVYTPGRLCQSCSVVSENMPPASPIGLFVEKMPTTRNVFSSTLNRSPTRTPKVCAARQPSMISSGAVRVNERPETTLTPYAASSAGASPISRKKGWSVSIFAVWTNAPIAPATPGVDRMRCNSASEMLL